MKLDGYLIPLVREYFQKYQDHDRRTAGRQLSKMPPSDLITLRDFYERQVVMEERKERIHQDKGPGANFLGDFRR